MAIDAGPVATAALVGEAMRRGSRVGEELNPRAVFVAVSLSWVITAVAGAPSPRFAAGFICASIFLIPGFPLVTAGLDLTRLDRVLDMIGAECAELGMPFTKPTRTPNSRRALETAEVVRIHAPDAFDALDDALFRTHWVDAGDLGDRATLDTLVTSAGADAAGIADLVAEGVGAQVLAEAMADAREHGVTATPAWLVDDVLLIPGAQPREAIERWVTKLAARDRS